MPIANIELRHLRYFVAVAESGSISKAARCLHVSQPPLSRQMRELEAEVGVPLFQREARQQSLTPAGKAFFNEAKVILQRFEDALVLTRETANREEYRFRIGHSSASSSEALPRILRSFQRLHPEAKVELRTMSTLEMIRLLHRGELDICMSVSARPEDYEEFTFDEIGSYRLLVAMSHQHPFVPLDKVSLRDLSREQVISAKSSAYPQYNRLISDLLSPYNPSFCVAEEHDGVEGVITAVEAGRGLVVVYEMQVQAIGDRLVFRELDPNPPCIPLLLFYKKGQGNLLTNSFVRVATEAPFGCVQAIGNSPS
jgi:DNA-binding transcriptional LysR family regulator